MQSVNKNEKFCENLRLLLDSRGYSCKRLAEELDSTPATFSRYLTGIRSPDVPYVIKIAKFFNCSTDWLLGLTENRFDKLTPELNELINLYSVATPSDRNVIHAVLEKYGTPHD